MLPNSSEIYIELESTMFRLVGLTGFNHSAIINAMELQGDYSCPEESEAIANIIHTETVKAKALLSDFLKAMQQERAETNAKAGNKKAA